MKALVIIAATAGAAHAERLYVRAGVLHVEPLSRSSELVLSGVRGPATLAISDGPIAGSGAAMDPVTVPAAIIGYALSERFAVETVLGAPFKVRFRATGTLADMSIAPSALGIATGVPALGAELGEADAAPPLVTLLYRRAIGRFTPYGGGGLAMLVTYNARATNPILTAVAQPELRVDPAPGLALQAGLDLRISRRIRARVDVKYVAFMKAHATVEHIQVRTPGIPLFDHVEVGTATMDLWVNPLVLHAGVGVDL